MATTYQLHNFCGGKNSKNWQSETIQVLQSHSPQYGDVQVTFSRFYWNLKWPPWINFIYFGQRKNSKNEFYNHITHPLQVDFFTICDHKNSYLIYGGGWYRSCGFLLYMYYRLPAHTLYPCTTPNASPRHWNACKLLQFRRQISPFFAFEPYIMVALTIAPGSPPIWRIQFEWEARKMSGNRMWNTIERRSKGKDWEWNVESVAT